MVKTELQSGLPYSQYAITDDYKTMKLTYEIFKYEKANQLKKFTHALNAKIPRTHRIRFKKNQRKKAQMIEVLNETIESWCDKGCSDLVAQAMEAIVTPIFIDMDVPGSGDRLPGTGSQATERSSSCTVLVLSRVYPQDSGYLTPHWSLLLASFIDYSKRPASQQWTRLDMNSS
ncbi:hypothetical protein C8J57DRAFT_1260132 [Mycena rebaudengoi]|nr:hypothetical protein C8J57DRAFT_1260132 [Mycena rebaudengoi]